MTPERREEIKAILLPVMCEVLLHNDAVYALSKADEAGAIREIKGAPININMSINWAQAQRALPIDWVDINIGKLPRYYYDKEGYENYVPN